MKTFYQKPFYAPIRRLGVLFNSKMTGITVILFFCSFISFGSHFRGGTVTWTRISETATTIRIRVNVSLSWGAFTSPVTFVISGGNSGSFTVPMTYTIDPVGGWYNGTGSVEITLNKSSTLTRMAFTGCCKISTLLNNRDGSWNVFTVINTSAPGSGPVSTMPAIINMPVGAAAATFSIPASDPDAGSTLSYRLATTTEMSGGSNPAGLSINPETGLLTFNTIGKVVNQQFNAMVVVTDNHGNQLLIDFMINMTGPSTPPAFDYSVTPANASEITVIAGQQLSFPIRATDPDAGSSVRLSVSGLPSYITLANFADASLPALGNPSQTTFTWTPTAAQINSTVILNFIATDNVGVQSSTSVTIRVAAEPAPVFVDPTPSELSVRQIIPGNEHYDQIVASSSLGSNVSIGFQTGVPLGATLSPEIPTPGANPGSVELRWTPTPADFGQINLQFQALISAVPTIFSTRSYSLIVNTPPQFASSPVLNVNADEFYSYAVTISDPEIPYGDVVDILATTLPSWLTLTDNGNGTALLSGTPAFADGGIHAVELEAQDKFHTQNPPVRQIFNINVITCTDPVIACPADVITNTDAGQCSASVSLTASATGSPDPVIVYSIGTDVITSPYNFPIGTTEVTVTASNTCKTETCTFNVTVTDAELPVITASPDVNISNDEGKCSATVSVSATAVDNCTTPAPTGMRSDGLALDAPYPVGTTSVTWNVTDDHGNAALPVTQTIVVSDTESPVITHNGNVEVENDHGVCGAVVDVNASGVDNCSIIAPLGTRSDGLALDALYPVGTTTIVWTASDEAENDAEAVTQTVVVTNTDPVVDAVVSVPNVSSINSAISLTTRFIDTNVISASIDWDDNSASDAISQPADEFTVTHAYASPGVYSPRITVTDACGKTAEYVYTYIVIYDPNGGFVTGGGWIQSPQGAYAADPSLTGKASFGFVAKYKKGTTVPEGNTEFQFHAGNLNFNSTAYEWLVVAGYKAQYKGTGTINGSGNYTFMLTAIDGDRLNTTGPDRVRIKILDGSELVYDNKAGAADDGDDATALEGGSIVIHDGKNKSGSSAGRLASGLSSELKAEEVEFRVYPNPVADVIHFTYQSESNAPVQIQLIDLQGRSVKAVEYDVTPDRSYTMDIYDLRLKTGFYVLKVQQGSGTKFTRMVKQ